MKTNATAFPLRWPDSWPCSADAALVVLLFVAAAGCAACGWAIGVML